MADNSSFFILQKNEMSDLLDIKLEKLFKKEENCEIIKLTKLLFNHSPNRLAENEIIKRFNEFLETNKDFQQNMSDQFIRFLTNPKEIDNLQESFTDLTTNVTEPVVETSATYCKKGAEYYVESKLKDALESLNKSLEMDPNNADALNIKGLILVDENNNEEALELYNKAILIDNYNVDYHFNKGNAYYDLDNYEMAINSYKFAIGLNSTIAKLHDALGQAYFCQAFTLTDNKQKLIKNAILSYDKAISLNLDCSDYYFNKSESLYELDENKEALAFINKAILLDPSKGEYFFKKGQIVNELADEDELNQGSLKKTAIDCFNKAIELGSSNDNYDVDAFHTDLGYVYFNLKRFNKSFNCFDEALKLNANNFSALNGKGLVLNDKGRGDKKDYINAIECYNKAIELEPNNAQFYYNKAVSYHKLGTYDSGSDKRKESKFLKVELKNALNCYQKAIELEPKNAKFHYEKGFSFHCIKEYDSALECFNKSLKLDPKNAKYHRSKGDTLTEIKKFVEAKECYKKAIKYDPQLTDVKKRISIISQKILCLNDQKKKENETGFSTDEDDIDNREYSLDQDDDDDNEEDDGDVYLSVLINQHKKKLTKPNLKRKLSMKKLSLESLFATPNKFQKK